SGDQAATQRYLQPLRAIRLKEEGVAVSTLSSKGYLSLNDDQRRAVSRIVAAKDYVCIQGMPGTGKSSTIAYVVKLLQSLGQSVLISAYTHTAVDNLLLKLKDDDVQ